MEQDKTELTIVIKLPSGQIISEFQLGYNNDKKHMPAISCLIAYLGRKYFIHGRML